MMTGFLKHQKGKAYCTLTAADGRHIGTVRQGQYLYMCVRNCWIPVRLAYSKKENRWYFEKLESIPIYNQMVMVK